MTKQTLTKRIQNFLESSNDYYTVVWISEYMGEPPYKVKQSLDLLHGRCLVSTYDGYSYKWRS